ncbi:hypothetical protein RBU61_10550 [Tissierella sp. MB52-C2]|uniref:hypothetical protein n=1 Tax=Tissierella sp. MB52-C2 TaxID=3070999 RepID=UPI00280B446B|nr:hypothetical protein [Tissierella sp. MB52-C2]WMM23396.1 hypothetical protein RBU61_10550 [Tissierella sp. MB52-C2]
MKNNIKKIFFIILTWLICSFALISCTKNQYKTITIEENNQEKDIDISPEKKSIFEINKIYKYDNLKLNENQLSIEFLIGWFNNENIASVIYQHSSPNNEVSINEKDYKYSFTNEVIKIDGPRDISLSLDGNKVIYTTEEEELKIFNKDLNKNNIITKLDTLYDSITALNWSNNSRYLSFAIDSYSRKTSTCYIYDTTNNIIKKIKLKEFSYFTKLVVSDDGTKGLLTTKDYDPRHSGDVFSLYLIDLDKNTFSRNEENKLATLSNEHAKFIDSNKILFINTQRNSLNLYDLDSKKSIELDNNVKGFETSTDLKNIVYSQVLKQDDIDIYACNINENTISNKELLYKGFMPVNIYWSQDNKKILLAGKTNLSSRPDYTDINEYLTIEFK